MWNLFKQHSGWVSAGALVVYVLSGLLLGRESTSQALTDLVVAAGLVGLHFKE